MYAPVVTGLLTYDVPLDLGSKRYCRTVIDWPFLAEWIVAAEEEPDAVEEVDMEL